MLGKAQTKSVSIERLYNFPDCEINNWSYNYFLLLNTYEFHESWKGDESTANVTNILSSSDAFIILWIKRLYKMSVTSR